MLGLKNKTRPTNAEIYRYSNNPDNAL